MAINTRILQIVKDNNIISLDFGQIAMVEYDRKTAKYVGVGERVGNVDEGLTVTIKGNNDTGVLSALQQVEQWLVDASRRQEIGADDRVFVHYTPQRSPITWRAEILSGDKEVLNRDGIKNLTGRVFTVGLAWQRRGAWENASLTQIPISNCNGTRNTSGLAVYNAGDLSGTSPTKRCNYVEVDASDIEGGFPAPVYLEITNTYSTAARRLYVSQKVQGNPSFQNILEAESATLGTGVTVAACPTCSNLFTTNVANVPATVRTLYTFGLSSVQAAYILSQWVRPMARFSTPPNNSTLKLRLTLKDNATGAVVAQSNYQAMSGADYLQTLPTLLLSPNQQGQTTPGAMNLIIEGIDSAGAADFSLDFVDLMPVEAGIGFRYYKPIDETLVSVPALTGMIADDEIDNTLFIENRQTVYVGFGGPLLLVPNRINRLYFHADATGGLSDVARSFSVKLFYRQRTLAL